MYSLFAIPHYITSHAKAVSFMGNICVNNGTKSTLDIWILAISCLKIYLPLAFLLGGSTNSLTLTWFSIVSCKLCNWFSCFFLSRRLLLQWPAWCHTWNLSCPAHMFHHLKNSSQGLCWHSSFHSCHQIIQTFIDLSIHLSTHYLLKVYSYENVAKFHHCAEALQTSSTRAGHISAWPSQYLIYNFVLILVILNSNLF